MSDNPYESKPQQLAISIGYRPKGLIAADVLPEVPVNDDKFEYSVFDTREGFTIPDTKVGRKSVPTQVSFGSSLATGRCHDWGLTDVIPNRDVEKNANKNLPDPIMRSTEFLTGLVYLDREVRVSKLVFNKANYTHKVNLDSNKRFDIKTINALEVLLGYLDEPIMRPNIMTIGQGAWTALRTNPFIVKAAHGNDGDAGAVSRRALADLLEIDEIYVGRASVNNARKGKAANMERTWGKHIALHYRENLAMDSQNVLTWGFSARYGSWVSGQRPEPKIGLHGAVGVKVGETRGEVVCAKEAGYFIENAAS